MKRARFLPSIVCVVVALLAQAGGAAAQERASTLDLPRARELDGMAARAFREGRYRDAIRFFAEAYRLGAPSIELWNIARCHQRLDEPDQESELLERYLAQPDLSTEDRAEAARELAALNKRPSTASIDSAPRGATVQVDQQAVPGTTPLTVKMAPGKHRVRVRHAGFRDHDEEVEARYGRAVLVEAKLQVDPDAPTQPGSPAAVAQDTRWRRVVVGLDLGVFVPRLGGYTGPLAPFVAAGGHFALLRAGRFEGAVGLRGYLTEVRWGSGALSESEATATGCPRARGFRSTELGAVLHARVGATLAGGWRAAAELGAGLDTLTANRAGGEVFEPSCAPSFGVRPLFHLGTEMSFAAAPALRIVLTPLVVQLHPAFEGARATADGVDATGTWWRVGVALGAAFAP